jgi:acyl-CoA thioester hydrolase
VSAPVYRHVVTAEAADIDALDHVSNLVYVRWVLDAARAHSAALGWDYAQYQARGTMFIVRRQEIDYLLPVKRGETVAVDTCVAAWKQASCVRATTVTRLSDGAVVARAATTWAHVRWPDGRPQRIPDDLRALFSDASASARAGTS